MSDAPNSTSADKCDHVSNDLLPANGTPSALAHNERMTVQFWCHVVGTGFQIFGLGFAAWGVRETRREYAPDRPGIGRRMLNLTRPATLVWVRARNLISRMLNQQTSITASSDGITSTSVVGDATASAHISHGPLDRSAPMQEQLRILDNRSRLIRDDVHRLESEQFNMRYRLAATESQVDETRINLENSTAAKVRELAIGGLSREAWGLGITAFGVLVSAFAFSEPGA